MTMKVGIEVEVENTLLSYHGAFSAVQQWCPDWVIEQDGSLRNSGYEIKSSGPTPTDTLTGKLCQLYPVLARSSGTWRAAIHVHVDARATSWEQRALILAMGYVYDMALFSRFSPERVESNFCVPLEHKTPGVFSCISSMIEDQRVHNYGKYSSINVLPLTEIGSVEFRHMRTPETSDDVDSVTHALGEINNYAHECAYLVRAAVVTTRRQPMYRGTVKLAECLLAAIDMYDEIGGTLQPDANALGEVLGLLTDMWSYDSTLLDVASIARVVESSEPRVNLFAETQPPEEDWEEEFWEDEEQEDAEQMSEEEFGGWINRLNDGGEV